MGYREFIEAKRARVEKYGFEPVIGNDNLFDWQARIVRWAVMRGRAALFEGTGLGKTLQSLVWCENIVKQAGPILLVCPLGVRLQTKEESAKFGIGCDVRIVQSQADCGDGINITNYDRIDKFEAPQFAGVCLDESSVLKGLNSKTRATLCEMFSGTRYRLACTATPSPNDHTELGNHAEFLGVMRAVDMQSRFFYHDSGDTGTWALMPHAAKDFWGWVASWAVCVGMPSNIGGSDDGYILPELVTHRHFVEIPELVLSDGMLFNIGRTVSATNMHAEKRLSVEYRVNKALEIITSEPKRKCVVWCDSNQEQDMLTKSLGGLCASIQGSDKPEKKEAMEREWRLGDVPILLTKSSIMGAGLNWQHCSKMVFVGLTYSFEQYYQSIRRCWRFGQANPVDVHLVIAETESAMQSAIARKENDFEAMRSGMAEAMRDRTLEEFGLDSVRSEKPSGKSVIIPSWMKAGA